MVRLLIVGILSILLVCGGCNKDEPYPSLRVIESESSAAIEKIEESGYLCGIEEVRLNEDQSVTLVDADNMGTGLGCGMFMSDFPNGQANLITGQSCLLTDGDHAFITYELVNIDKGRLTFMVNDKFDAVSFGDGIKIARKAVTISSYTKEMYLNQ